MVQSDLVKTHEPGVIARAAAAANLEAFGSENARQLHQAWRSTVTAIDTKIKALEWYC
jgi:hypothetical protein